MDLFCIFLFCSHDINTQQCSPSIQHVQVNNSYAQSMSQQQQQGIKSPRISLDSRRLLDIEKQHQSMINNSLSMTTSSGGGYVCSTSSDSTNGHISTQLQVHPVRVLTPPNCRLDPLSRVSSAPLAGNISCSTKSDDPTQVTARKSSHKISSDLSSSSFKTTNQQKKSTNLIINDVTTSPMSSSSATTTIDPTLLVTRTKYNRRNNPDLEKRRIHFCDHPGNTFGKVDYNLKAMYNYFYHQSINLHTTKLDIL